MSDRRAGAAVPLHASPARHGWPVSYGLLAAHAGAAVVTAVAVLATGTRHPAAALVAYGLLAAVAAAHTRPAAAPGIALVAWLFYNGFIIGRHAHLSWHGAADVKRLAILLAASAVGSMLGSRIRAARPRPAPGDGLSLASDHAFRS
jgi:hypothetical protein